MLIYVNLCVSVTAAPPPPQGRKPMNIAPLGLLIKNLPGRSSGTTAVLLQAKSGLGSSYDMMDCLCCHPQLPRRGYRVWTLSYILSVSWGHSLD